MQLAPTSPLFKPGQRVGLGWHGGHCNYCAPCRRGDFILCENRSISGINYDGGYADYVIAPANALAFMPDGLADTDAGPLICAGITTFNALRNSGARTGDTVAIVGIGGLGHLAVQYAAKAGYRTVAIARGQDKAPLAKQLGAHIYIDNQDAGPRRGTPEDRRRQDHPLYRHRANALDCGHRRPRPSWQTHRCRRSRRRPHHHQRLPTAPRRRTVAGWPSGTGMDSEDTLNFSALTGVKSMNEVYPLEKAEEAYARMMSGKARFRVVLKMQ